MLQKWNCACDSDSRLYTKLKCLSCGVLYGCVILSVSGCEQNTQIDEVVVESIAESEVSENYTTIDQIDPPVFDERFAVLYAGSIVESVAWGVGKTYSSFIWDNSGYPGFGYPIVIQVGFCDFSGIESCTLKTAYGQYYYEFEGAFEVLVENNRLCDKKTGTDVLTGTKEKLYLYNAVTDTVFTFRLTEGTEIRI